MNIFMVSTALSAALIASVPLAAQPSYGDGQRYEQRYDQRDDQRYDHQQRGEWNGSEFWRGAPRSSWERIGFLQQRIDRGVRDGSLDRREARRASAELMRIRQDTQRMRRGGRFTGSQEVVVQRRLDELSRNLRWMRGNQSWSGSVRSPYATDYDATRYYRDGPQYRERRLSAQDEVYQGSDGRYYCRRDDGTTGLIIGGLAGGVFGNVVDGGSNRLAGTLIGGALGALAGREIDRNSDVRCR